MKFQKNFTTGILTGICCVLMLFTITGLSTEKTESIYEFYDLKNTQGIVFNKITGELKYEKIREKPIQDQEVIHVRLSNWNGFIGDNSSSRFFPLR